MKYLKFYLSLLPSISIIGLFFGGVVVLLKFVFEYLQVITTENGKIPWIVIWFALLFFVIVLVIILLVQYLKESKKLESWNRFERVYRKGILLNSIEQLNTIESVLTDEGCTEIRKKEESAKIIIEGVFPQRWYSLPKEAGGNKLCAEKLIILTIYPIDGKSFCLIELSPTIKSWIMPTSVMQSSYYYIQKIIETMNWSLYEIKENPQMWMVARGLK